MINERTDYTFLRIIGSGGFAKVYECHLNNKKYALKLIKRNMEQENLDRYLFEKEILKCKELKHPNIIEMKEYIEKHKIYVLVNNY